MLASADATTLDDGPRTKSGTERLCALTREVRPVGELIRFVVGPDGSVVADLKRKLPGRGLWVSNSHASLGQAVKRGVFAKGFRRQVKVAPTLADNVGTLLVRGVMDALAMAAKAGCVVSGFMKVERALTTAEVAALIQASDGAADGIRKMSAIARQAAEKRSDSQPSAALPVIDQLSGDELDLALSRSNVIHAALLAGAAATTVLMRSAALARFRETSDVTGTS